LFTATLLTLVVLPALYVAWFTPKKLAGATTGGNLPPTATSGVSH